MKWTLLIPVALICLQTLIAQSVEPTVTGSAGEEYHDPDLGSLAWTIGELDPIVIIKQTPQITLEVGFHHHFSDPVTSAKKGESDFRLHLYPNPTRRFLNIESERAVQYSGSLYSPSGRHLRSFMFKENYRLNLQVLPDGAYLLQVRLGNKYQNFQIVKTGLE